jgi:3-hydroxyisobutyrate dehydrogenase-like beta-hydroxyacid dehydrogenase
MHSATHPVGVIGIGFVGLALVERLRAARIKVLGWDSDPARRDALAAANGIPVAGANDVFAACDNVVLALCDDDQTETVITEALAVVAPGSAIVDCGSADPDRAVALAVRLARRGCCLLDAPLSGSSQQIKDGEAVMIVGGERDAFDALQPILAAISSRRFHLGPVGSGSRAKLATNLLLGLNRAALAEALVFAESLGLDLPTFVDLVRATPAYSRAMDTRRPA